MIIHIDGNSFYASCERLFRPDLDNRPIAVLSNNDGIIVALNNECKALGYKRGDVFFKVKHLMEYQNVAVFSSNYTLYADMSMRMNLIYHRFAPHIEIYSIDESFLFLPAWTNADYKEIGYDLKHTVTRETGIPVSVGVAPTKTLAKLCNKIAKKHGGVCDWNSINQDETLAQFPVEDIWGIGYAKARLLKRHGVTTALKLKNYPLDRVQKYLTITGFNTVQELNGVAAIDRVKETPRQVLMVSRSFSQPVYELDDIIIALCEHVQEAVSRMRAEQLSCRYVGVCLMTNAFAKGDQYGNQMTAELPCLSAYLPDIQAVAGELLRRIFRPGFKYRKVAVVLTGLAYDAHMQLDLFSPFYNRVKEREPLMQVFDAINNRYGRGTIKLASGIRKSNNSKLLSMKNHYIQKHEHDNEPWKLKREYLSPCYTTAFQDIPVAY